MSSKHKRRKISEDKKNSPKAVLSPDREKTIRIVGWASILLITLNLVLFSFRKTTLLQFWIALIAISILAFVGLWRLKK